MKKIFVTGARSGIINKVVDKLIDDYFIYVSVHTKSELQVIKRKYSSFSNVVCLKLDVTNDRDIEKIKNIDVDIIVLNAAVGESGSILELDTDKIRSNFEVNVFGNIKVMQVLLGNMIERNSGKIIFMSSLAGLAPIPFLSSYCASKASIIKMAECLRMELGILDKNINVVLVEPGLYYTGFNELMLDKKYDDMDTSSYFDKQMALIRKSENLVLKLFEKKSLDVIINKIVESIRSDCPKKIYRSPFFQVVGAKIYMVLFS